MAMETNLSPIGIVLPAATPAVPPAYLKGGIRPFPRPPQQQWAPAWFYRALRAVSDQIEARRHCERSEAIQGCRRRPTITGLLRRFASRNDVSACRKPL